MLSLLRIEILAFLTSRYSNIVYHGGKSQEYDRSMEMAVGSAAALWGLVSNRRGGRPRKVG